MSIPQPKAEHIDVLRKYFGHSQFRPMQWKIIHSIIEEKCDNCVIMATGYGKSLCYQYPAVYCQGLTIVISPLISLMQDQVLSLQMSNIPASFLGSAQQDKNKSLNDVLSGVCRVMYVTPEWSTSEIGNSVLKEIVSRRQITLLAVDEAHCISQWGCDFRHAYRNLANLRTILPKVPILALTATATPKVRSDICRSLNLRNPKITVTSFNRPNLYFSVSIKTNSNKPDQIFRNLTITMEKSGTALKFLGPTIIYCSSKNRTEEIADTLKRYNFKCDAYHAGLSLRIRKEVHEKFLRDQLDVVVATVAFGMGIDKPNVRCVIHYGLPKDIESYYQEIGRAGRDGLPAFCHILYSSDDITLNKIIMSSSTNAKFQEHKELMSKRMQYFCETRHCRRHLLLSYFDESLTDKKKDLKANCCDNCDKLIKKGATEQTSPKIDLTAEIKLLLEVFKYFDGRYGLGVPVKFIRGLKDEKISKDKMPNKLFGAGKEHSEAAWKALAKLCIRENLLTEKAVSSFRGRANFRNSFPISTIDISKKGQDFIARDYKEGVPFELSEQAETLFRRKKLLSAQNENKMSQNQSKYWQDKLAGYKNGPTKQTDEQQAFLFHKLKELRDSLAETFSCAPHMVIENSTCLLLAINPPSDLKELTNVKGFNETKVEKFGQIFLDKIREFFGKTDKIDQCENETNDRNEEFIKMKHLNENAASYFDDKYVEYILTDEVVNDFESDLQIPCEDEVNTSQPINDYTPEKQNSVEDMWGDESDDIFGNVELENIDSSGLENCETSLPSTRDKELVSTLFLNDKCIANTTEENINSRLISFDKSKLKKNLTSSLIQIDNDWQEGKKEEFTGSSLSNDDNWMDIKEERNITSSLVSIDSKRNSIEPKKDLIPSLVSLSNDQDRDNCQENKIINTNFMPISSIASTSNIMCEDDKNLKLESCEKKKRSVPAWLAEPKEMKKRMKNNSIFKLK